jgi:hypothetical protein
MGIIARILPGLDTGLPASVRIPGRRSQGPITCMTGAAGALPGGWLAAKLFRAGTVHGFFTLSAWLTVIAGAGVLLLAFHLATSRGGTRSRRSGLPADRPDPQPPSRMAAPIYQEPPMIIIGVILLIIGFVAKVAIIWTIGIIVVIVGVILALLGMAGHAVGGRRHYY